MIETSSKTDELIGEVQDRNSLFSILSNCRLNLYTCTLLLSFVFASIVIIFFCIDFFCLLMVRWE